MKRMLRDAGVDFEDLGNSERVAAAVICEWRNKEFPNKKI
nr:MAG TPA: TRIOSEPHOSPHATE ISOMERASE GLYCOSOMAL [Caudoviricetes sp.]